MKLFIHLIDGIPYEWKMTLDTVRQRLPEVEISDDTDLSEFGYETFDETPCPVRNEITQDIIEVLPIKINNRWTQQWALTNLDMAIIIEKQTKIITDLASQCVAKIQQRLDEFARTRNYDGILSACTYANSKIPTFAAEGQFCTDLRDSTWAAMYQMYGEVQAGLRVPPTTYEEVEALLPEVAWP